MQLAPYLYFNGDCKEAFERYASVLGGKIVRMMPHAGSPAESRTPPEWLDKIMHARMVVGDQVLMASDAPPGHQHSAGRFSVSVNVKEPAEADRIFHALAEGDKVFMPIAETFWALRFGMVTDRFGIPWMVNCEKPMPQ